MSLRNQATRLMLDQIDTVNCSFDAKVNGATSLYSYKCKKGQFIKGDLAIVKTSGKYKVVQVVNVDEEPQIDVNAGWDYGWIVDKLSTDQYDKCMAAEKTLMDYISNK